MLKIDESIMTSAADVLSDCAGKVNTQFDQMDSVASYLNGNPSLEEESIRLKKAMQKAETIRYQLLSLTHVMRDAVYEYKDCEKQVVASGEAIGAPKANSSRVSDVKFEVSYTKMFNWKTGGK